VNQGVIEAVADPVRSRLFAIAAARKAKWIVAAIWLAVFLGSFALDLPGRFADAEQNENVDYLPASAESTKALGVTERLNDGDVAPAIVVYHRDGGLTPADRAAIAADVAELNRATRAFDNTTAFGAPVVSRDDTTALVQNQVKVTGEDEDIRDPVAAYREVVERAPGGLEARVSGPAGVSADARAVFDTIDGTLVGAALGLVIVLLILIYRSPIFWLFPIVAVVCAEIAGRGAGWVLSEIGVTITGPVVVDPVGARHRRGHRLRAAARRALPRGAAPPRGQARGDGARAAPRRAGDLRLRADGCRGAARADARRRQQHVGDRAARRGRHHDRDGDDAAFLPALLLLVGRRPFWPDTRASAARGPTRHTAAGGGSASACPPTPTGPRSSQAARSSSCHSAWSITPTG
jgi:MMPL family